MASSYDELSTPIETAGDERRRQWLLQTTGEGHIPLTERDMLASSGSGGGSGLTHKFSHMLPASMEKPVEKSIEKAGEIVSSIPALATDLSSTVGHTVAATASPLLHHGLPLDQLARCFFASTGVMANGLCNILSTANQWEPVKAATSSLEEAVNGVYANASSSLSPHVNRAYDTASHVYETSTRRIEELLRPIAKAVGIDNFSLPGTGTIHTPLDVSPRAAHRAVPLYRTDDEVRADEKRRGQQQQSGGSSAQGGSQQAGESQGIVNSVTSKITSTASAIADKAISFKNRGIDTVVGITDRAISILPEGIQTRVRGYLPTRGAVSSSEHHAFQDVGQPRQVGDMPGPRGAQGRRADAGRDTQAVEESREEDEIQVTGEQQREDLRRRYQSAGADATSVSRPTRSDQTGSTMVGTMRVDESHPGEQRKVVKQVIQKAV